MDIFNELGEVQLLDKQLNEADRVCSTVRETLAIPKASSGQSIEEVFEQNLQILSDTVKTKIELFSKIDGEVQG